MDSSAIVPNPKLRSLRKKNFAHLMVMLFNQKYQLTDDVKGIAEEYQELQKWKEELRQSIADLQTVESKMIGDTENCSNSVQRLAQQVAENKKYCAEKPTQADTVEMWRQNEWADVDIANATKKVKLAENDLRVWKNLVIPAKNEPVKQTRNKGTIKIELIDIDSSGLIEKKGSIKIKNEIKCCLCLKNDINCVLFKCGHECCCTDCINQPKNKRKGCPLCHRIITKVVVPYRV